MIDLVLKKSIAINAPVSNVWQAVSTSEWWDKYFPATKVISDWKVDSPILFIGNYQEKNFTDKGTILKFETNKIMQYNYWSGFSGLPDILENYMIITFELEPEGSAIKLMLTQENFNNETQYKQSDFGWNNIMLMIKELLEK